MPQTFQLSRFRFTIKALEEIVFPAYKGSVFRGGFGYVFKKVACTQKDTTCDECLLKSTCVYTYIFETPPPRDSEILRLYPRVPNPFVIEPPLDDKQIYTPGTEIDFHLVLIGRAADYLPYFIYAFTELGKAGIGRNRAKYELTRVEGLDSKNQPTIIYTSDSKTIIANPPVISFNFSERDVAWELASHVLNHKDTALEQTPTLGFRFLTPARVKYNGSLTDQL